MINTSFHIAPIAPPTNWTSYYQSEEFRNDPKAVLKASKKNPEAFKYASPNLIRDKFFSQKVLIANPAIYVYLPTSLMNCSYILWMLKKSFKIEKLTPDTRKDLRLADHKPNPFRKTLEVFQKQTMNMRHAPSPQSKVNHLSRQKQIPNVIRDLHASETVSNLVNDVYDQLPTFLEKIFDTVDNFNNFHNRHDLIEEYYPTKLHLARDIIQQDETLQCEFKNLCSKVEELSLRLFRSFEEAKECYNSLTLNDLSESHLTFFEGSKIERDALIAAEIKIEFRIEWVNPKRCSNL